MAAHRPPGLRPSFATSNINTTSHPNLRLDQSTAFARKASLNALTAAQPRSPPTASPKVKMLGSDGREIVVGDLVDVPGAMHGVVKFIGPVRGKNGVFAGVELSRDYAPRGKNDGDVEGVQYFKTSVPGSGIFLPVSRASRRSSGDSSDYPLTPSTPSFVDSTRKLPQKNVPMFTQSVGPGARPPSPKFKPKGRQSLPRPGSPLRKGPVLAPPTPSARGPSYGPSSLSKSQIGTPRYAPNSTPKSNTTSRTPQPPRSYSRTNSRVGNRVSPADGNDATPTGPTRSSDGSGVGSHSSGSGFTPIVRRPADDSQEEIARLKKQLEERDTQLKEHARSLAQMEDSLEELQNLMPESNHNRSRSGGQEDADSAQLRAIIREKNEKISMLIAEFDNHRADFRSTIDTLELASTETERVYEKRVEELLTELRELQDRNEDVETVARQLKQLEDLVQELEEGLEDSRRGETEARGELELLRPQLVSALAERDKLKLALNGNRGSRDVAQRDDEIRGLKAIIHSLSSGPDLSDSVTRNGNSRGAGTSSYDPNELSRMRSSLERLERERKELQGLVERKNSREGELERELDRLQRTSVISNAFSDRTATQEKRSSGRDSKGTVLEWRGDRGEVKPITPIAEADSASSTAGSAVLWCEICESGGHDILTCPNMDGNRGRSLTNGGFRGNARAGSPKHVQSASISSQDPNKPRPLHHAKKGSGRSSLPPPPGAAPTGPLPNPMAAAITSSPPRRGTSTPRDVSPKSTPKTAQPAPSYMASLVAGLDGTTAPNKWCAICEHDGHDSINCSMGDQF